MFSLKIKSLCFEIWSSIPCFFFFSFLVQCDVELVLRVFLVDVDGWNEKTLMHDGWLVESFWGSWRKLSNSLCLEESTYVIVGAMGKMGFCGHLWVSWRDVTTSIQFFFLLCPTSNGKYDENEIIIQGLRLFFVKKWTITLVMSWLLRRNHERYDPLRSIVFVLHL
jgi:hypothetical protein